MERITHSPLAKCMEQHIVLPSTLIAVELIEETVAIMEGGGVLGRSRKNIRVPIVMHLWGSPSVIDILQKYTLCRGSSRISPRKLILRCL